MSRRTRVDLVRPHARYDEVADASAALVISSYSSSFGLASRLLAEPARSHVRNIYAMVRIADEIVDGVAAEGGLDADAQRAALDSLGGPAHAALCREYARAHRARRAAAESLEEWRSGAAERAAEVARLRDATGLSTHLLIRDQRDVVFVAKAQTHEPMFSSVKVHVGTRLPAHATVHGQVMMGDLSFEELRQLYPEPQLERFTERTPATVEELYGRVRESAALGYAVSEASFERGISVVSAPVRDQSGKITAALTVTIPRSDIGEAEEREPLIVAVCQAALELSERLSYRPRPDDPTAAQARRRLIATN